MSNVETVINDSITLDEDELDRMIDWWRSSERKESQSDMFHTLTKLLDGKYKSANLNYCETIPTGIVGDIVISYETPDGSSYECEYDKYTMLVCIKQEGPTYCAKELFEQMCSQIQRSRASAQAEALGFEC